MTSEHPSDAPAPAMSSAPLSVSDDPHETLLRTPLRQLLKRSAVTAAPSLSIAQAAQLMSQHRVSSLLLVQAGPHGDQLVGLVTDRDLRTRVLAAGVDPALPVSTIATPSPMTVDIEAPAFDALLLMARHNVHHMPVLEAGRPAGMITATDVTQHHGQSAVSLAGAVHRQDSVPALAALAAQVRQMQRRLAAAGTSAQRTGELVTAMTDALTQRLLHLGEVQFGPPPVPYAWVAAGSQARAEQTAKSDQDNCLVLDDAYEPGRHGDYFKSLAGFVNDGLDACGYVYCPGEMMARTDAWRQPQRQWLAYFDEWTRKPEPKALMLTCVFFDLRCIHGSAALLETLRQQVLNRTRGNSIFLSFMANNALLHRPPLSLFGGISTQASGGHRDTVDLKHGGIVPIVDLARVYALAGGHAAVGTHERLRAAAGQGEISAQGARDLSDALEFLGRLRLRHQALQMERDEPADNMLSISELGHFERDQLKQAFGVVQTLQAVLAQRYR